MKRTLAISVAAAVLLGCGLLRFEVDDTSSTVVEGGGVLGGLLDTLDLGGLDDFDLTIEQALADQGVEPGDLRSVVLTELSLHGEPDLGFVTKLDVYLSADGVPEFLLATLGDVAPGQTDATFTLTDVDLAEAVQAGGMQFRVDATGELPAEDTAIDAHILAEVEATAQGACNAIQDEI